jgi:phosphoglycerol transferase
MKKSEIKISIIGFLLTFLLFNCSDPLKPKVYQSTLEEGIYFNREGIPSFTEKIEGLYNPESFGAWTNNEYFSSVKIFFKEPLPKKFELHVISCGYRENGGVAIPINIGKQAFSYVESPCWEMNEKIVLISLEADERVIEIIVPNPISPAVAEGIVQDPRILGLALSRIFILPQSSDVNEQN